eukprot:TRINITY_DN14104_c0_g1_i1.p1 TRINITY_DN14104_c0_g1~~TRINITY_DN14104_c0_g1_i1.p1  ORF type:complete len:205 (+),score=15.92 TRINITY_DN14104_c0_g1_i1:199-813(+)
MNAILNDSAVVMYPLVSFSFGVVVSSCGYVIWRIRASQELKTRLLELRDENTELKEKCRVQIRESRRLRTIHDGLAVESKQTMARIENLDNRTLDLLEAVTSKDATRQIQLVKEIYKDQLNALRNENQSLVTKTEALKNHLICARCNENETNSLLRPCGHSVCGSCYAHLFNAWNQNEFKKYQDSGPLCPFCKREVVEVLPKYH